jgi:hypothetical protein
MKAHILHIGIIDETGAQHSVDFKTGVNVITGRSSTGKSALIEIFDYCFGSSDYTVPVGVITKNTSLYFCVLKMRDSILVLAREPRASRALVREEFDINRFSSIDWLSLDYFSGHDFYSHQEYLKALKRYFGIMVTDIDEDLETAGWRGRKSSTPSVRSFTSFILQHQNLIANKHAIFYRFDQKEKREQVIDHLKIFLGFADQTYFTLMQRLNELEGKRRQLARALPRQADAMKEFRSKLHDDIFELEAISGKRLNFNADDASMAPRNTLDTLSRQKVTFSADSDEHVKKQLEEQERKSQAVARLRGAQLALAEVESSIAFAERYDAQQRETVIPNHVHLAKAECPFCHSHSLTVEKEANQLASAIGWLNNELRRSSYRKESQEQERASLQKKVIDARADLKSSNTRLSQLRNQVKNLEQVQTQYELTVRSRARLEATLAECAEFKQRVTAQDLEDLDKEIKVLRSKLSSDYDLESKLSGAERRIQELMQMYGTRFDFERTYRPINLRFSLSTFDLWHEESDSSKVFLRAMGSGANWLSCHLVLFLSLQRYFCELGDKCLIPPILFIDQPSQVYFPAILDGASEFDPKSLAEQDKSRGERAVDEDLRAVTNLFEQLVLFCDETETETGTKPQIIVSDHADNLKFGGSTTFESIVRRRWRDDNDGFIDLRWLPMNNVPAT